MINKNQYRILNLFKKDIFLEASIREIVKILKKKSYQRIYEAVKELEENSVLKIKRVGHSNLVSIDLNFKSISLLSFLDEQEALSKDIPNMNKILDLKEFLDDIILVTGSYAKGRQNKISDIDLVVITKDDIIKKQKLIENLTDLFIPKFHPIVISYKDFVNMLLTKEENYGKELFKNRLLFRNSKRYYELLKEAIENGFRS